MLPHQQKDIQTKTQTTNSEKNQMSDSGKRAVSEAGLFRSMGPTLYRQIFKIRDAQNNYMSSGLLVPLPLARAYDLLARAYETESVTPAVGCPRSAIDVK